MIIRNTYTKYGEFIKKRRKILNLTQADLAKKLNCSPQAIFSYEDNRIEISLSLIGELSNILKLSVNDFIKKKNSKPEDQPDLKFDNNKFVQNLIDLRKNQNLSQKDLAAHLKVSFQRISKWETNMSHPSIKEFVLIAKYYDLDLDELYYSKVNYVDYKYEKKKYGFLVNKKIMVPVLSTLAFAIIAGSITPIIISSTTSKNNKIDDLPLNESSSNNETSSNDTSTSIFDNNDLIPVGYHKVVISYYYRSQKVQEDDILKVKDQEKIDFPIFIHEGYTLSGYKTKDSLYFDILNPVEDDLHLYADLTIKNFTVVFHNYCNKVISTQKISYLSSATAPSSSLLYVEDAEFIKWDKDFTSIRSNLEIYPIYQEKAYTITLYLNKDEGEHFSDGTFQKNILNFKKSEYQELPIPLKKDYKFVGWLFNGEYFTPDTKIYENAIFTPKFVYAGRNFTISFLNTNNIYVEPIKIELNETLYSLPTLTFENQYCNTYLLNGEEFKLPYTHKVKKDLVLTCVWEEQSFIYSYEVLNDNKSIKLNKIKNINQTIIIPETINGYFVKEIGRNVIDENNIVQRIEVNAELTYIEEEAFKNNHALTTFLLHDTKSGLRLGKNILKDLHIKYLKIPNIKGVDGVSTYFYSSFGIAKDSEVNLIFNKFTNGFQIFDKGSDNIYSLSFEENVVLNNYEIIDGSFNLCTNLKKIHLSEGITLIDFDLFPYIEMEQLVLPSSLETIYGNVTHHIGKLIIKAKVFANYGVFNDVDVLDLKDVDTMQVIYPEKYAFYINKEYHASKKLISGRQNYLQGDDKFINGNNKDIKVFFYQTLLIPDSYTSFEWIQNYHSLDINYL